MTNLQRIGPSLARPEYLHVLINTLPVHGLALSSLALGLALLLRNRAAQIVALTLVLITSASAYPAYLLGERAYHGVYLQADSEGQKWLDAHKHRAEKVVFGFYALAALALAALLVPRRRPKAARPLALATLVLSLIMLGLGGWIAEAGGKVRHPEFRSGAMARAPVLSTARGVPAPRPRA